MYFDKRMIYIILGILLITGILRMGSNEILNLILILPGLLIAITFHEFAHAYAAVKLGDDTPRRQGRLSLNPLSHLDPIGSVLLLFAGFGWGKPVEINPRNFDRKYSMAKGEAIVSVAGPLMNFVLAFLFAIIYFFILRFAQVWLLTTQIGQIIEIIIISTISVNIGLGVFNLLPFPPLNRSKIFISFMPFKIRNWLIENQQIFYIIFLIIWITGLSGIIVKYPVQWITNGILWIVSMIFSFI